MIFVTQEGPQCALTCLARFLLSPFSRQQIASLFANKSDLSSSWCWAHLAFDLCQAGPLSNLAAANWTSSDFEEEVDDRSILAHGPV